MKHSYTILYVDDDPDDLQLIAEAFLTYTEKLRVAHAHNGKEALEVLEKMKGLGTLPCLIILDINMPVLNGLDTLVHLRIHPEYQNVPVVIFSTSENERDRQFARKWGADFITKPSKFVHLKVLVDQFVSRCIWQMENKA